MPRRSIYVPAPLEAAMGQFPEVNWSSVCQRAIIRELARWGVFVSTAKPYTVITSTEREDRHA